MENESNHPQREKISDVLKKYKEMNPDTNNLASVKPTEIPTHKPIENKLNQDVDYEKIMSQETDPDLMTSYEMIKLPSKGMFYPNRLSEVAVEYMTSKDEDLLTTPSLLENGTVMDVLLKRKIKTKGVNPENMLTGDRSAIILFLRTSSYGHEYSVEVTDPRTGKPFKAIVDLTKLSYKEITELPDENGYFNVELPMRKKLVKFKLLTKHEEDILYKKSEAIKEAYNEEVSSYNTMKLKSHIISIDGKSDRTYIDKFVDAMPALDAYTIRKKILDVNPDVDLTYEFTTKDGYSFKTNLILGIDFFFPNT